MRARLARVLAIACLCACAPAAWAQAPARATPAQVKAAFVVNFVRYTSWPASSFAGSGDAFHVCALGADEAVDVLERIVPGTRVADRPLVLERVGSRGLGSDAAQALGEHLRNCHVLYVAADARSEAGGALALVANADVLTVGDVGGFASAGGMLELVPEGTRIGFRANPAAIAATRLEVSAKVLKLAQIVARGGH